jgi:hypothetical protein
MRNTSMIVVMTGMLLLAGCHGRGHGAPPGQVKHATGVNPASGHVHTPGPGPDVKVKVK